MREAICWAVMSVELAGAHVKHVMDAGGEGLGVEGDKARGVEEGVVLGEVGDVYGEVYGEDGSGLGQVEHVGVVGTELITLAGELAVEHAGEFVAHEIGMEQQGRRGGEGEAHLERGKVEGDVHDSSGLGTT